MVILDPLSRDADPRLYVPLDSAERALAAIVAGLKDGRSPVLLTGPTGVGKTLLLAVLADRERMSYHRVRFSPSLYLEPDELPGWLLRHVFGKSASGAAAELDLREELRSRTDERILLVVDEIERTPVATVRKLAELLRAGMPTLAVVAAATPGRDLRALAPLLAPGVTIALPDALPELEIETLYETILAHPGLSPRLRHRMANVARSEIVGIASGIPRLLKNELTRRNQERPGSSPELPRAQKPRWTFAQPPAPSTRTQVATQPDRPPLQRPRRRPGMPTARHTLRSAAVLLASPFMIAARAARALLAVVTRAGTFLARAPRAITSAAGAAASAIRRASVALSRSALEAGRRAGTWLARPGVVGARAARSRVVRARACAIRVALGIDSRARAAAATLSGTSVALVQSASAAARRSATRLGESAGAGVTSTRSGIGAAVRSTEDSVHRASRALAGSASGAARRTEAVVRRGSIDLVTGTRAAADRARTRLAASALGARRAGATLLVSSREHGARARREIHTTARVATSRLSVPLARAGRAALRAAPAATLPATALIALALFSGVENGGDAQVSPGIAVATATHVNVQVNARPWARVRIDGVDVGATPLSRRLTPGVYQLEAEFPDGRRIQRAIDVGPERRFVSLP